MRAELAESVGSNNARAFSGIEALRNVGPSRRSNCEVATAVKSSGRLQPPWKCANAVNDSVSDTPRGSFPKSAHLLKHSDFQRVYQQGRRHFSGNMTVFYLRTKAESAAVPGEPKAAAVPRARRGTCVRVGFTVSKALGNSVERNRMRRRTREAVRHHLSMLDGMGGAVDVVVNPKKSLLKVEFSQISSEIERAFRVIRQTPEASDAKSTRQEARRR